MENTTDDLRALSASDLFGFDRMSEHWPATYRGRIPTRVKMAKDLGPDMWGIIPRGPRIWVNKDDEVAVKCNQHGAMSLLTPHGDLGVKPLECEIIEWREPNDTALAPPPQRLASKKDALGG